MLFATWVPITEDTPSNTPAMSHLLHRKMPLRRQRAIRQFLLETSQAGSAASQDVRAIPVASIGSATSTWSSAVKLFGSLFRYEVACSSVTLCCETQQEAFGAGVGRRVE